MAKFYESSPLFNQLSKEFKKIPESKGELSDKVDRMVVEIKNILEEIKEQKVKKQKTSEEYPEETEDQKAEKQKAIEEIVDRIKELEIKREKKLKDIIVHIHPILKQTVYNFYKRFQSILSRRGFAMEDVYDQAVAEMMKYVDKWEDQETREEKGEIPAHFISYFFNKNVLPSLLKKEFVVPALTKKRTGYEVSMDQPMPGHDEDGDDVGVILPDQNAENALVEALKNEEIKIGRDAVLNKLYTDKDPIFSLVVILKFGFGKDFLDKWKEKFDLSVKDGKIKKTVQRYVPKINQMVEEYSGDSATLREVGSMLGVTRQMVKERLNKALKILKNKYPNYENKY